MGRASRARTAALLEPSHLANALCAIPPRAVGGSGSRLAGMIPHADGTVVGHQMEVAAALGRHGLLFPPRIGDFNLLAVNQFTALHQSKG